MRRWEDNRVLADTKLGKQCEELFGAPYCTVHRADLHRGLLKLLPKGVVNLGFRCITVEELPCGVRLHFADGTSTMAHAVVGADGIHSTIRNSLIIDEPRFSGQTIYRGLVPAERLPFLLNEPKVILWLGPDQHCICYPVSGGKLVSFAATVPVDNWCTESSSAEGRVEDLAAAYSGWHDQVRQIIDAADMVSRWALHDRDTIERWSSQRVTIAGDAAHPMLPFMAQGANQAIEDVVALATCLRTAQPGGLPAALQRYEEIRKTRTAEVHQMSRNKGETFHLADGNQQQQRDAAIADAYDLRNQGWLYAYDAELAAVL
jgi:salicylate hydroxylase